MQYLSDPMHSSALLHGVLILRISVGGLALLAHIVCTRQNACFHSFIDGPTWCPANNLALFVNELPSKATEVVWYGAELRSVTLRVVIELEKRHSQELHVFRNAQNALFR